MEENYGDVVSLRDFITEIEEQDITIDNKALIERLEDTITRVAKITPIVADCALETKIGKMFTTNKMKCYAVPEVNYFTSKVLIGSDSESTTVLIPIFCISKSIRINPDTSDGQIVSFVKAMEQTMSTEEDKLISENIEAEIISTTSDTQFIYAVKVVITPQINNTDIALENIAIPLKSPLKAAIDSTLAIFKQLDASEYERVKSMIESFTKESDLINFLINPINVYFEPTQEPSGLTLNNIKKSEEIIISEHVYLPFKANVVIDGIKHPVRSAKRLSIYHSYVRKNQQIANKETKSADSKSVSDILGMSAGVDKVGTFSDAEWTTCLQQNNNKILKELCGPASADLGQKRAMKNELMLHGEVSLESLPDATEDKRVIHYLDFVLKSMGIDSDLVQYPE